MDVNISGGTFNGDLTIKNDKKWSINISITGDPTSYVDTDIHAVTKSGQTCSVMNKTAPATP